MFWRKREPKQATREEALGAYLLFMEGRVGGSFTFPPGNYSRDQIVGDVEGIIRHRTQFMRGAPWADRLREFG